MDAPQDPRLQDRGRRLDDLADGEVCTSQGALTCTNPTSHGTSLNLAHQLSGKDGTGTIKTISFCNYEGEKFRWYQYHVSRTVQGTLNCTNFTSGRGGNPAHLLS